MEPEFMKDENPGDPDSTSLIEQRDGDSMDTAAYDAYYAKVAEAYTLTVEEFAARKVVDRDVILFILLRDMAGGVRTLLDTVDEAKKKIVDTEAEIRGVLDSPEVQNIKGMLAMFGGGGDAAMKAPGRGGLMSGLFKGGF